MKILFLSRWFPYPADNGSKLRVSNLLRGLSQRHDVTLLSFADQPRANLEAPEIRALCSEVCVVRWKEFNPQSLSSRVGYLSIKPRSIVDTFSAEMSSAIRAQIQQHKYDLVIASQLPMAAYHRYFDCLPAIFDELELGSRVKDFNYLSAWIQQCRDAVTWFKLHLYLSRLLTAFQAVTVASNPEKDLVSRYFPQVKNIVVVPNCLDMRAYRDTLQPQPNRLVFTGSFRYRANYEAMAWFVGEVFPHILRQLPDTQLLITGDHLDLPLPSVRNVQLTGHVEDVKALIASATVAIAPLRQGGGTRLKILEAMAAGTPVVATPKGAEGLGASHGEHILVADDPVEFSNYVISLLRNETLRLNIAGRARLFVKQEYDCEKAVDLILNLADSVYAEQSPVRLAET